MLKDLETNSHQDNEQVPNPACNHCREASSNRKFSIRSSDSVEQYLSTLRQLKRIVGQLSHLRRTSFHILHCVGYIQEPHIRRFGPVFELGKSHGMEEPPVGLCNLYSSTRWVPLSLHMRLTYTLAVALGNCHRVGWVREEVKSENIRLLKKDKQEMESMEGMGVDFAQPWLFGFECSRPEDVEK